MNRKEKRTITRTIYYSDISGKEIPKDNNGTCAKCGKDIDIGNNSKDLGDYCDDGVLCSKCRKKGYRFSVRRIGYDTAVGIIDKNKKLVDCPYL